MATPRRIYCIYEALFRDAETIRDFAVAKGEKVSGTVTLLLSGDRDKLLRRWGDEMQELYGVLEGTHNDPYLMEATQCFYWASLFSVSGGVSWDDLAFESLREQAATTTILQNRGQVLEQAMRIVELGAEGAKPQKLFLLWWAMDNDYRHNPRWDDRWSVEQMMDADLHEMKKRPYLAPILAEITD